MNEKKAIGYLRISTKGQDDKFGLEVQKEAIENYAKANGFTIVEWLKDVVSGVSEDRPALNAVLYGERVKNPPYEAIICFKSDRIARDIKLYFYFLFLLEKKGVKLISVNEDFADNDPLVNVQRSLMIFCAEQERRNIELRTSAGRDVKCQRGGYAGGRVPFGYFSKNGYLVVNNAEAPIVKMIFKMRDEQKMSYDAIASYLNEQHIISKTGKVWKRQAVFSIYKNRKFYEGYYKYGKMKQYVIGEHEAIL